ncbi:hypothetical protein L1987_21734 [Smallanthus sonchifolius]|uniref:Uncharacterized protein n=1 Tax=Smallanthus sonchifolius TaxID=185202 RepID=A0ACB9IDF5_9ASTR|nr:hypothetical protein L1987_21734 [Smallanthus sonchifolius]
MLRSSLNASRRLQPGKVKVNKKNKRTSIDHKQTEFSHMTNQSNDYNDIDANAHSQKGNRDEEKSSRRTNFYGFSKMFDVIMRNLRATRRSKQTYSKSCPVSIKSSPMHDPDVGNGRDERRNSFYSRDHSIQAAIAHCKKSSEITEALVDYMSNLRYTISLHGIRFNYKLLSQVDEDDYDTTEEFNEAEQPSWKNNNTKPEAYSFSNAQDKNRKINGQTKSKEPPKSESRNLNLS